MVELEVDGKKVEVNDGSMVMDAANKLGVYVPHFCYHKKLSIAANCRMCLVQVEKAPKPMPACATPVSGGMKVWTKSEQAIKAQKGVMEFLLINHPLDCPICDQGGECQLQDLAVGYGGSASRYTEEKRVVFHKNVGPLVSMEEMSRCIHCTRCVRFGQEVAGVMELGMLHRGEHAEITSFVGRTVDSELSGNMIDICPVGALTSKPFRYAARTWELSRRKSVSPHDSLGANLILQVKGNEVMRVVPLENEALNECWISDKERFSYEALNSTDAATGRLTQPMVKQDGQWIATDWQRALEYIANGVKDVVATHGADGIAALASPHATLEELFLLQKLVRGLGSGNIDFRLRAANGAADSARAGVPWLGMPVTALNQLDRVLVIGSFLRKDHPLMAQRLRQAAKKLLKVSVVHAADDDWLIPIANKAIVAPSQMVAELAGVLKALHEAQQNAAPNELKDVAISDAARAIAASLNTGSRKAIFLGNFAAQHPDAAQLNAYAQAIATLAGATLGHFGEAANSVGGYLAGAYSNQTDAAQLLGKPRKAYVLLSTEPELDCANPMTAVSALNGADMVVALSPFRSTAMDYADVLLPIAPFSETAGAFVNTQGTLQAFSGVVKPLGDTRPGWKVLRVLGNLLGIAGFEFDSPEAVRAAALGAASTATGADLQALIAKKLDNRTSSGITPPRAASSLPPGTFERVADVPIYATDSLVRRAESLQRTRDAKAPTARLRAAALAELGIAAGETMLVGAAMLPAQIDESVPAGCVRVAAAHPSTVAASALFGLINVEKL